MKKTSIVILNWNGFNDTVECLESLKKVKYLNYEVILVDNGSKNDEASLLENRYRNYIKLIKSKENVGFGEGNNIGIKKSLESNSDYVIFLNNDTVVNENFLEELIRIAEIDEKIAIVGAVIYDYFTEKLVFGDGKIDKKLKIIFNPKIDISKEDYHFSEIFSGACFLLKTKYIQEYSLFFDKNLFLYGEEIDFSLKLKKLGLKITIAHKAKVFHKESQSLGKELNYKKIYYNVRNRIYLAKKHLSFKEKLIFYFLFLCSRFIRGLQFLYKKRLDLFKANIDGIIDGFKNRMGKTL